MVRKQSPVNKIPKEGNDTMSKLAVMLLILSAALAGCSQTQGPPSYHLSGNITFNGQPVPAGTINFDPVPGSSVIPGHATIKNGKYDTRQGVGHGGGKMQVRIAGFDGVAQGELTQGNPLFPEVTTTLDLPTKDDTRDFNLPLKP